MDHGLFSVVGSVVLDAQEEDPAVADVDLVPLAETLRLDLATVDLDIRNLGDGLGLEPVLAPADSPVERLEARVVERQVAERVGAEHDRVGPADPDPPDVMPNLMDFESGHEA